LHPDGVYRAIDGAGTTLDTGVLIGNNRLPVNYFEHLVWTDDGAHAAAVADLGIKSQGYDIFQVLEHFSFLLEESRYHPQSET
jgi:hypothetical protein